MSNTGPTGSQDNSDASDQHVEGTQPTESTETHGDTNGTQETHEGDASDANNAAAGSKEPQPPPSETTQGQSTLDSAHAPIYEVFPSCSELMDLKEETKRTEVFAYFFVLFKPLTNETFGLKQFFGIQAKLRIDQYTLRHKAGYIKIEDGQVAYIYPIRASQVRIRTAPGEEDQYVQWRVEYRYCLQGSLIFEPAQEQADYVMFLFQKIE
ncbi:uncharacterized protein FTOL_02104 [Fusarium torulosum]|uniref:Uncharacterized protein n=1 Tax=Fusarium torulosum TaxID=33205 RepID=A0AAE8SEC7_9HYPO|nr:uncharacterized protein FTOL_02104 [Fusarium torulosum]